METLPVRICGQWSYIGEAKTTEKVQARRSSVASTLVPALYLLNSDIFSTPYIDITSIRNISVTFLWILPIFIQGALQSVTEISLFYLLFSFFLTYYLYTTSFLAYDLQ
jgi:hypothetical protein